MTWTHIKDELPPEDQLLIGICSFDDKKVDWICIGKVDEIYKELPEIDYRTNFITTVHVGVHSIKWWHPIPELPEKEDRGWFADEDWIDIIVSQAPVRRNDPFQFIVFDEIDGIAECEYWGGYQSDTWSCKHYFKKPLFWRPFPQIPIPSYGYILQA